MSKFTRQEVLDRLHKKISSGKPVIIGASGVGIIAKTAEKAGIDIIMAYCTGPARLNGNFGLVGYMGYVDCNGISIEMGHKMIDRVVDTPMVAGVGPADPYRDVERLVEELLNIGFSGITNVPTVGGHEGAIRNLLEKENKGYNAEVELIRMCRKKDIFTVGYAFDEDQTKQMVQAGVDLVCPHAGITADKTIQYEGIPSVEAAAEKMRRLKEVALRENPEVLVACHGGPFVDPQTVEQGLKLADMNVFVGASTIERIPVENAIYDTVSEFVNINL